jgi:hypothetical protein
MGTGSFPGVKSGRGVTLSPHNLLVPWSWKSRAIPPLFLWAVRPVQRLNACTVIIIIIIIIIIIYLLTAIGLSPGGSTQPVAIQ